MSLKKCDKCNGDGNVVNGKREIVKCPKCGGNGVVDA